MDLSHNDLVEWEKNDIPDEHKELGKPIYRVKTISKAEKEEIAFMHHTVSTTDGNYGKLRKKPNTLRCHKISIDMLGNYKSI